ncbi:hypothetical protein [Myxococcus eversor]|uniref:hypothetical protein n=1 Tax=Myxococcus eversor TaxID=2709661 RepID=UPI0013D226CC|nr:hypothetical protein [Myxococcus eversor]
MPVVRAQCLSMIGASVRAIGDVPAVDVGGHVHTLASGTAGLREFFRIENPPRLRSL